MKKVLTGALAALTLAGAAVATTTPASAQPFGGYHGGWHGGGWRGGGYRGWGPGAAVGAGLVGLAVGATIAADHPYYGYGYGAAPYYGPGYYGCSTRLRWNPYWGGYQRVRACY